jgi:preprotein translocase subunit SecA
MNRHRRATYSMRKEILHQANIRKRIGEFIRSEAKHVAQALASQSVKEDKFDSMVTHVLPFDSKQLKELYSLPAEGLVRELPERAEKLYEKQEKAFGDEIIRKVERDVYLQVLDNYWMQHLESMDHLREGIHWAGVGQRDPLVEYRKRSQVLFEEVQLNLRHEVIKLLFHAQPVDESRLDKPVETELTRAARGSVSNADKILEGQEEFSEEDFVPKGQADTNEYRKSHKKIKKARKAERQRKKKAKKKKRK